MTVEIKTRVYSSYAGIIRIRLKGSKPNGFISADSSAPLFLIVKVSIRAYAEAVNMLR